jgi:hypothetical protein
LACCKLLFSWPSEYGPCSSALLDELSNIKVDFQVRCNPPMIAKSGYYYEGFNPHRVFKLIATWDYCSGVRRRNVLTYALLSYAGNISFPDHSTIVALN